MMWASPACAMALPLAALKELRRQRVKAQHDSLSRLLAGDLSSFKGSPDYLGVTLTPLGVRKGKCESCGSREFKQHHGQTVCAYCRSGA
jgi:hypothetical protein